MTILHLNLEEIKSVARAGGGLRLNAQNFFVEELAGVARAAKAKGATIILEGCAALTAEDMAAIGRAGDGCVIFE